METISFQKIFLERSICKKLSAPWEDALLIKLLGRNVGFIIMQDRLKKLWQLNGVFDMLDLDYGYFLAKLDCFDNRLKVLEGGSIDHV